MPSRVPLIFGAASVGTGTSSSRYSDHASTQEVIDVFVRELGYSKIDTSRRYGGGTSEELLGMVDIHGARMDTKLAPPYTAENIQRGLSASIEALKEHKIRVLYLHQRVTETPFDEVLHEINECYKKGLFEEFGISNSLAWEVAEMYTICKEKGYVLPTVYQGPYSVLSRHGETELFPALRKYDIRFTAYSPLAGGLLSGSLTSKDDAGRPGGRFDESQPAGKLYRSLYTQGNEFDALGLLQNAASKHGLSVKEVALRWLQHHSALRPADGVIVGASSVEQLRSNVRDCEGGALPVDLVAAAEQAWALVRTEPPPSL